MRECQFHSRVPTSLHRLVRRVTAVVNIFTVVVIFTPSFSPIYRATIVIPNLMVYNLMASHVFRKVKLGAITNGTTMSLSTADLLANSGSAPVRFASIPLKVRVIFSLGGAGC